MRVIHCADLHLDSKMRTHLSKEQARTRRIELLQTYERMIAYGAKHGVTAVLIAGDLFDTRNISQMARNVVLSSIRSHPDMYFFYIRGNHDRDNFLSGVEEIPKNLKLFNDKWKSYSIGRVVISGMELTSENSYDAGNSLIVDPSKINLVMLHGQESESTSKTGGELINLRTFRGKGIDYLALGHVHHFKKAKLDARAIYCYPGCLEGRGFDECGACGFVMLDIDETSGEMSHHFISSGGRRLHEIVTDVTGCMTTDEMTCRIERVLQTMTVRSEDLISIVLQGELNVSVEKNLEYIRSHFHGRYYYVKVEDNTRLYVDPLEYRLDQTLKGEFVRVVMADAALDDSVKVEIIRVGLAALAGEEVQGL